MVSSPFCPCSTSDCTFLFTSRRAKPKNEGNSKNSYAEKETRKTHNKKKTPATRGVHGHATRTTIKEKYERSRFQFQFELMLFQVAVAVVVTSTIAATKYSNHKKIIRITFWPCR